ncbi:MAG: hypothetical protein JWO78_807, partial [Micavibrio sp.]|nr:hypothetical protein [Micavibrio sp.]
MIDFYRIRQRFFAGPLRELAEAW